MSGLNQWVGGQDPRRTGANRPASGDRIDDEHRAAGARGQSTAENTSGPVIDEERLKNTEHNLAQVRNTLDDLRTTLEPASLMREVREQLVELRHQISEQDALTDRLQEDLAEARRDQVALLLSPGMKQLITLYAQLTDASHRDYGQGQPSARQASASEEFEHAVGLARTAIEAFGFEEVPAEEGTQFDRRLHYAADAAATDSPEQDKTIKSVVRPGFIYANAKKAAFPARVVVYKYAN